MDHSSHQIDWSSRARNLVMDSHAVIGGDRVETSGDESFGSINLANRQGPGADSGTVGLGRRSHGTRRPAGTCAVAIRGQHEQSFIGAVTSPTTGLVSNRL